MHEKPYHFECFQAKGRAHALWEERMVIVRSLRRSRRGVEVEHGESDPTRG